MQIIAKSLDADETLLDLPAGYEVWSTTDDLGELSAQTAVKLAEVWVRSQRARPNFPRSETSDNPLTVLLPRVGKVSGQLTAYRTAQRTSRWSGTFVGLGNHKRTEIPQFDGDGILLEPQSASSSPCYPLVDHVRQQSKHDRVDDKKKKKNGFIGEILKDKQIVTQTEK